MASSLQDADNVRRLVCIPSHDAGCRMLFCTRFTWMSNNFAGEIEVPFKCLPFLETVAFSNLPFSSGNLSISIPNAPSRSSEETNREINSGSSANGCPAFCSRCPRDDCQHCYPCSKTWQFRSRASLPAVDRTYWSGPREDPGGGVQQKRVLLLWSS
jgi:hypothetical protein